MLHDLAQFGSTALLIAEFTIALVVAALAGDLAYWFGYPQGAATCHTRLFVLAPIGATT